SRSAAGRMHVEGLVDTQFTSEAALNDRLRTHYERSTTFVPSALTDLRCRFRREGFVKVRDIVPDNLRVTVKADVLRLLGAHGERRDLLLETTGNTPRFMSVVRSGFIADNSTVIGWLYRSGPLLDVLAMIAGERLLACPSKDEEFLITRQERKGDTHG